MKRTIRAMGTLLAQNVRLLLFLIGFLSMYAGVAGLSRPVANIAAGVILMAIAVAPYVRRSQRGE